MKSDPILSEMRRTREAHPEQFAGDIRAMLAYFRRRQQESGRAAITRPPKRSKQMPSR